MNFYKFDAGGTRQLKDRKLPKKGRKHRKSSTLMICPTCNIKEEVCANERYRAARVRCNKCGGPMNRPRDL